MKNYVYALLVVGFASCNQATDIKLQATASALNKQCPMMVDKETRLDNAVALPGNTFQYRYTLVNMTKDQLDTNIAKQTLRPNMVQSLSTMPELKDFRDNKVVMEYNYSDKTGAYMMKITIKPEEYAK